MARESIPLCGLIQFTTSHPTTVSTSAVAVRVILNELVAGFGVAFLTARDVTVWTTGNTRLLAVHR
jgi:hypothetical protein